jgi:predicted nucleic acid-binding protein
MQGGNWALSGGIPEGHVALDSGALIEILEATPTGAALLEAIVNGSMKPHASLVNIAETEYVLCRKVGHASAARRIDSLLASGYLSIEDGSSIHRAAAAVKCSRAIALADCYTLAVAEANSAKPVFAHRAEDLLKESGRKPFPIPPVFLD